MNRENSVEVASSAKVTSKQAATRKVANQPTASRNVDREPMMAYLRIRPHLGGDDPISQPYLTPLSETSVRMTDPHDPQNNPSRFRPSTVPPSSIYAFSHVFLPNTSQSDFFTKTTLPLVQDALQGQSSLLFAYGVTNSGKTYTVQGGAKENSAGILPRSLDVIFNSIEGLHGDGKFRPVRLHGIEPADATDSKPPQIVPEPALAEVLGQHLDVTASDSDVDPTVIKVDRNYEYTIWISYAEVYNEKVYDLLTSVKEDSSMEPDESHPRSACDKALVLARTALPLKSSPPSDNSDSASGGKYIAGLRQFRIHTATQAKALVKLGQLHRRVFGTLANSESSRSHGMVIIKVVRVHRGEKNDPSALQISRLTLVDLAGSERTKHTHTTGDRLKEAGNINKSLMVLGQCMEVMRSNQRKLAMSLSKEGVGKEGRMDTKDVKKGLAVVPFRHSKLTEALMDYFVGDGRAVMIVNVNPYDTGYDENSHVMKFAALAREVYITPTPAPLHRLPAGPGRAHGTKIKELGPLTLKDPEIVPNPYRRKVTIPMGGSGSGKKPSEAILEVLEEDEPNEDQEDASDDEPINPLVDALFDEVENLRMQLFESEMRCAIIEAETREEVMREMEDRMRNMEVMYSRRLMTELEQNELKTDAKIDMLHQAGFFGSPEEPLRLNNGSEALKLDIGMTMNSYSDEGEFASHNGTQPNQSTSFSESPLSKKRKTGAKPTSSKQGGIVTKVIREVRKFVPEYPLLSDNEEAMMTETEQDDDEDEESVAETGAMRSEIDEDDNGNNREYNAEDDSCHWVPSTASSSNRNRTPKGKVIQRHPTPSLGNDTQKKRLAQRNRLSKPEEQMNDLMLYDPDDSAVILPTTRSKARWTDNEMDDDVLEMETSATRKKKRQLGKKPVMTEEQIERHVAKSDSAANIRRLTLR